MNKEIWPEIEKLYELAKDHPNIKEQVEEIAGNLEVSWTAFYEDQYNSYCDMIDPHLGDGSGVGPRQLTNSVTDTLNYLIKFWIANREDSNRSC